MEHSDLLININPKSMFSESIKSIRTNLQFSAIDNGLQIILVTSPEAGNGKSFVSANLAAAYAQDDKKVLVIDCDLRRGRQHTIFEVENKSDNGYSNLILNYNEDMKITRFISKTNTKNIDLIPTGPTPPNPIELLASNNNEELIKEIKKYYDIIILDCPPILGLSDTQIMTKFSDANILIVASGDTPMELIERSKKAFENANSKIDGVVINKANIKGNSYYSSYYTNDYYTTK